MNNLDEQQGIIDSLFIELDSLTPPELGTRISSLMDEQPHLMGFLFNLDDDFSEETHSFLLKSCIVVRDVMVGAGIPINVANNEVIEQIVGEKVEHYDSLSNEATPFEEYTSIANSPQMLEAVLKHANAKDENIVLITDVIISVLEESAADEKERKKN